MTRTFLLAAMLGLATPLAAQQLEPGTRIRVRPPCSGDARCAAIIGNLRYLSADSIEIVATDGRLHAMPLTPTTRLDVSHGLRRRIPEGLGVGLLAGIVVGAISSRSCGSGGSGDNSICGLYYLITVPPGVLIGGIVGASLTTEWWLPPPERRMVLEPTRDGVRLGMRMAW